MHKNSVHNKYKRVCTQFLLFEFNNCCYFNVINMLKSRYDVLTQTLFTVTTYRCVRILYVPCTSVDNSKLVVRVKNNFISKPVFISLSNGWPNSRFLEAWRSAFSSVRPCKYRIFLQPYNTLYYIIMATLQEVNNNYNDK